MSSPPPGPLVSTAWLAQELGKPDLKLVDAPFYLPGDPRTPQGVYAETRLPGAVLFDLDRVADRSTGLPHMLASPEDFAAAVGALGIGDGDRVVIYDHLGLMSAARVWWNFRVMGHDQAYVLDGGLPRWQGEGRQVEHGPAPAPAPKTFNPRFRPQLVRDIDQVEQALRDGGQVLDARPAGRFSGADAEPRPGLPPGHMPGARNLPFNTIVTDGLLAPAPELEARFKAAGVDPAKPIIVTCGSGVSAAVLALALARLGHWNTPVYDGSWTEWAGRKGARIAKA
jgi:thiosulfate/3-mercaptopyruvate sulfurtransferase